MQNARNAPERRFAPRADTFIILGNERRSCGNSRRDAIRSAGRRLGCEGAYCIFRWLRRPPAEAPDESRSFARNSATRQSKRNALLKIQRPARAIGAFCRKYSDSPEQAERFAENSVARQGKRNALLKIQRPVERSERFAGNSARRPDFFGGKFGDVEKSRYLCAVAGTLRPHTLYIMDTPNSIRITTKR